MAAARLGSLLAPLTTVAASLGGGIFLHVQRSRYTAGCVAGPLSDIRWTVRRLDPACTPRS